MALCLWLSVPVALARTVEEPLVDVRRVDPSIRVDLQYRHASNVFGRAFYQDNVARLRLPVARRLARVQRALAARGLGLLIWDAYRPLAVQARLHRLAPRRGRFVSRPGPRAHHCRGAAIDVTLVDAAGVPLVMPSAHDDFSARARMPRCPRRIVGVPQTPTQRACLLAESMRAQGFSSYHAEWWHFVAHDWARYRLR